MIITRRINLDDNNWGSDDYFFWYLFVESIKESVTAE